MKDQQVARLCGVTTPILIGLSFCAPSSPFALPFIDRKAPLGRAAEIDLKVAVCSQSISSLLAFRKA